MLDFPGGLAVKNLQCRSYRRRGFDPWAGKMPKGTATHSSIFAWSIPWTEGTGGLLSTGLQRVGQDGSDLPHAHTVCICYS